jgi:hypothetical protein
VADRKGFEPLVRSSSGRVFSLRAELIKKLLFLNECQLIQRLCIGFVNVAKNDRIL